MLGVMKLLNLLLWEHAEIGLYRGLVTGLTGVRVIVSLLCHTALLSVFSLISCSSPPGVIPVCERLDLQPASERGDACCIVVFGCAGPYDRERS